jgi:hypothetical protein
MKDVRTITAIAGVVLIGWTLREVFRDLFHPAASGSLSDFVARGLFSLMRRWKTILPAAGPFAVICVIACWVLLIALGFALIFASSPSSNFAVQNARARFGFWPMFYFSLEALTTLGLGDYAPRANTTRMLVVFEALIGFSIVTASVSSIVLIYPVLGRMRSFARYLSVMRRTETLAGLEGQPWIDQPTLGNLAGAIVRVRVDLSHFPIAYYFATADRDSALSTNLEYLNEVSHRYQGRAEQGLLSVSTMLCVALSDLEDLLKSRFVDTHGSEDAFRAYAEDHRATEKEKLSAK